MTSIGRIRIDEFKFGDMSKTYPNEPNLAAIDGVCSMEVQWVCGGCNSRHDPRTHTTHFMMPFGRGEYGLNLKSGNPIWSWDGNRDAPTLIPSFLCKKDAHDGRPRVHLHITAGAIVLSPDAEVVVGT